MVNFQLLFSAQGIGGNLTGPDLENRVGDQDTESPGRPVSSGLQMLGEPGHCYARTKPPWWASCCIFPSKCPSIAPAILRVDSLALWKIINEEGAVLIPKNRGENFSSRFLHSEFFGGWVSHYATTSFIVALSLGHSVITRFHPWSPITTGNHLDRAEKFQKLLRWLTPLTFLIRLQVFRDPLCGELPRVQIFMNDGSSPLKWDAQLLSYWFCWNPVVFQD